MRRDPRPRRTGIAGICAWAVAAILLGGPASAQQPAAATATPAAEATPDDDLIEPKAVDVVKRMVETLKGAQRFRVKVDDEYDAVQDDGETISFGKTYELWMKRPNMLRTEARERDGDERVMTFDGKLVAVWDKKNNVYATAEKTGDYDDVVDFLREDVGVRLPLADLFSEDLGQLLKDTVTSARYVGVQTIRDKQTDHVSLRYGRALGLQLWIEQGERAVPHRIVMTFEAADGRPQFRADLFGWDLSPRISDSNFAFKAPKDARAIPFVLPKRTASAAPEGAR
jgi:hypothetical protein